ncbi:MAG: hypothetical protein JSS66_00925 [Armatimonadetes bacterium]|nr:hypothetical protein [Armatimonadota bacterium]
MTLLIRVSTNPLLAACLMAGLLAGCQFGGAGAEARGEPKPSGSSELSSPMSNEERASIMAQDGQAVQLSGEGDRALMDGNLALAEEKYSAALASIGSSEEDKNPMFTVRLARVYLLTNREGKAIPIFERARTQGFIYGDLDLGAASLRLGTGREPDRLRSRAWKSKLPGVKKFWTGPPRQQTTGSKPRSSWQEPGGHREMQEFPIPGWPTAR